MKLIGVFVEVVVVMVGLVLVEVVVDLMEFW